MEEAKGGIDALLKEDRYFPPPPEFAKFANVQDADIYETNLMRRLAGLLYIDSKTMGDIKHRAKKESKE